MCVCDSGDLGGGGPTSTFHRVSFLAFQWTLQGNKNRNLRKENARSDQYDFNSVVVKIVVGLRLFH